MPVVANQPPASTRGVSEPGGRRSAGARNFIPRSIETRIVVRIWHSRPGHAHLPIALSRVRVAQREQPARNAHREVQRRARRHVTQIDVAAAGVRRGNRHIVHARAGHADGAAEWLDRNMHARHELGRVALGEVEDPQVRHVELARRQQAEARQDQRPPPLGQLEAEELDGEGVTGLGTRNVDRAGQRVDGVEVEAGEILGRGVAPDLPAGEVVGLDRRSHRPARHAARARGRRPSAGAWAWRG